MNVGDALPEQRNLVRPEVMPIWAEALQDPNPIHLDAEAVKAAGLGDRVINQGPINVAYLTKMLSDAFPGSTLEKIHVRFLANAYGGDIAVASGTIAAIRDEDGVRRVDCDLTLGIEDGGAALSGTATLRLA